MSDMLQLVVVLRGDEYSPGFSVPHLDDKLKHVEHSLEAVI
jgi:hypothetical protein